jgi:hypothetical protein
MDFGLEIDPALQLILDQSLGSLECPLLDMTVNVKGMI